MFITRVIKDLLASSNEKDFQRNNKEDIDTYQFVKNSTLHVVLKTFYSMFGNMMNIVSSGLSHFTEPKF